MRCWRGGGCCSRRCWPRRCLAAGCCRRPSSRCVRPARCCSPGCWELVRWPGGTGPPRRWRPSAGRGCGWCCVSIPRRWPGCRGRRCMTRPPGRTCADRTSWSGTSRSPRCRRRFGSSRRCGSWAWSPPPAGWPPWTWRRNRASWPGHWPGRSARDWPSCTGRPARPGRTCRTCCWTGSGTCCTLLGTVTSTPARTRACWP